MSDNIEHPVRGRVKFFNTQKGFGFIVPDDGSRDVFVSQRVLDQGIMLMPDMEIEYVLKDGKRGPYAVSVRVL